jgi:hypothetical protein
MSNTIYDPPFPFYAWHQQRLWQHPSDQANTINISFSVTPPDTVILNNEGPNLTSNNNPQGDPPKPKLFDGHTNDFWKPSSDWLFSGCQDFYGDYICPDCLLIVHIDQADNHRKLHQPTLDDHPSKQPEDQRLHWVGRFTDAIECVRVCEADLASGHILNYKIVKRSDGSVDVWTTRRNPDARL